ncbi:hypothetical protein L1987_69987 [Smallanthus sonchifolius]|uniref:Uncharacterized protein n=1 Tax=Smallanthus sonchifolius TaxID=185202 RepID=A0ACB9B734_9ASTR|nr:hypothetical protein L1987_69987 [Smallanthus sonchifolius]
MSAWRDGDGFDELILSLFAQPLGPTMCRVELVPGSDNSMACTNVKQCLRKVADGHFTAAVKVLCSSGVAPFGNDTMKVLVAKHPILPPPIMHVSLLSKPPLVVDDDAVLGCIKAFPKGPLVGGTD